MRVLVLQGPNLNRLGARDPGMYGTLTLDAVHERIQKRGQEHGLEVAFFQSNHEGDLVDYIQEHTPQADGVIINPGALTHYGLSLRDALADARLPIIEVHLSNIHAREEWRRVSVVAPIAVAQVAGMGWRGYLAAIDYLAEHIKEVTPS